MSGGGLDIAGLQVGFGGPPVVRDLSLTVARGTCLCIVGESGSGKSLTLLSAMRLLPRGATLRGQIRLGTDDLTALGERDMCRVRGRRIGMVFQEPMSALNPVRSIGAQVAESFAWHLGLDRHEALAQAGQRLVRVGLDPARVPLTRHPHELSGGQRQRVVIALATALNPEVLLADEPTTALDVTTQAQILTLFKRIVREDGAALVLVTHDLSVAADMADDLLVMRAGEVVERGPAPGVFRSLRHPYALGLLAASRLVPKSALDMPAGPPVLSAEGLVCRYGAGARAVTAVDGVSLHLARGETLGLVGESGSGKSTLAQALLGLVPIMAGEVRIGGATFAPAPSSAQRLLRPRIQAVFQDPYGSFNPRHRVGQIVAEPLRLMARPPQGAARAARVAAMLAAVGLPEDAAARTPDAFSGGQRQRIAIARALITEPDIVIFDEAVSALDVTVRAQILELIREITQRLGLASLFITHDLGVVRAIADRVAVMQAGRIVETGPVGQVFASPQHPYTVSLLAASPDVDTVLAAREKGAAG